MTPTLSTEAAKLLALNEKRTPGEWVVGEEEDRQNYLPIDAKKHGAFAEVVVQMADDEKPFAEGIANAAFIAAAPRMAACIRSLLEALREAERDAERYQKARDAETSIVLVQVWNDLTGFVAYKGAGLDDAIDAITGVKPNG